GALAGGWLLSIRFIKDARSLPEPYRRIAWTLAWGGALVATVAWASGSLPRSEPYGCWDVFRADLQPTLMGIVLLVPMTHLLFLGIKMRRPNTSLERARDR